MDLPEQAYLSNGDATAVMRISLWNDPVRIEQRQAAIGRRTETLQHVEERGGRVDYQFRRPQLVERNALEPESVADETGARRRVAGRAPVDRRISNERRRRRRRRGLRNQMPQPGRIGLPCKWSVATDHEIVREISREVKASQNAPGGHRWFIGEYGEGGTRRERLEHADHAWIRARVVQQMFIVYSEKSIEGIGWRRTPGRRERARDKRLCAFADHRADGALVERACAAGDQQLVDRRGEIASRVDEGAVEIKNDQTALSYCLYSANEVGVSHTVTRTTGSPSDAARSKMRRAIRSTVGLLSST